MKLKLILPCVALMGAMCWMAFAADSAAPSIQGSYVLDYRELPDGKKLHAPDVGGVMTFTKDHRNFNVFWTDNGKPASISIVSKYTLSAKEFTEENIFYLENNIGGRAMSCDMKSESGKAAVAAKGKGIEMKFPLHDEPTVVFEGDTMTATKAGVFVDHWKKMD